MRALLGDVSQALYPGREMVPTKRPQQACSIRSPGGCHYLKARAICKFDALGPSINVTLATV